MTHVGEAKKTTFCDLSRLPTPRTRDRPGNFRRHPRHVVAHQHHRALNHLLLVDHRRHQLRPSLLLLVHLVRHCSQICLLWASACAFRGCLCPCPCPYSDCCCLCHPSPYVWGLQVPSNLPADVLGVRSCDMFSSQLLHFPFQVFLQLPSCPYLFPSPKLPTSIGSSPRPCAS